VYDSDRNGWEMGSEDLDAWDATLQVCLARLLDDSADAARVLDHLAGTIASTHIPTDASATRAAELMLSHLETPPDAPALLGFTNDTLISTYPPEPHYKVASMWLIRTATRIVDMCIARSNLQSTTFRDHKRQCSMRIPSSPAYTPPSSSCIAATSDS
jgi:hypothetical protein